MSFDPTRDFIKERGIGSGIKYIQDGVIYNAGHVAIGKTKDYAAADREPGPSVADRVAAKIKNSPLTGTRVATGDALANAAAKLNSAGMGVTPVVPKEIADARRENAAAAAAEEHAV